MPAAVFLRAVEADVFPEQDRVFLRDGQIYTKMAKKLAHAAASESARAALAAVLPTGWGLWGENPILSRAYSAPLPDLCVIRGCAQDYYRRRSVPTTEDIALVVEVAETTLAEDRTDALSDYAAAGLPVYWIVNLVDWQVEGYTGPKTVRGVGRYARRKVYRPDQDVPVTIAGTVVARVPARVILPAEQRLEP
jgi:Uma2 family endonuclease